MVALVHWLHSVVILFISCLEYLAINAFSKAATDNDAYYFQKLIYIKELKLN